MTDEPHLLSQPPHLGPVAEDGTRHARFAPHELAIVLSHYEVGRIKKIRVCPLGSRRAPKLRIVSATGREYLLKRRAPGRDDLDRVGFTHELVLRLCDKNYPTPRLIGTRGSSHSMLELNGRIYELFDFVHGRRFNSSLEETSRSGAALGELHRLLSGYRPAYRPPTGTFHAAAEAEGKFDQLVPAVVAVEPQVSKEKLGQTVDVLKQAYREAARRVDEFGYRKWPPMILHGDWHPGNLLFRDGQVVGVLDFDSARLEPRLADVANGALQFSIRMSDPARPLTWPEGMDARRICAFVRGYDSTAGHPLEVAEKSALAWMMIEALIIESLVPIAATGSFARIPGSHFLEMVRSKVNWIRPRAGKLVEYLDQPEE